MMIITLEVVRQTLRETLGFESFTARFIEKVVEDRKCHTAAISRDGTLTFNPDFITEYVKTTQDMFSLVFHEILHLVFGHFIYKAGKLENLAADAVINATISRIYQKESGGGDLFRRLYSSAGLEGILRPGSILKNTRYAELYDNLYREYRYHGRNGMTTGELIQTLRILSETENLAAIILIGSHDGQANAGIPTEVTGKIAAEIKTAFQNRDCSPGFSETLESLFVEVLESRLSLSRKLLATYDTRHKIDRFKKLIQENRRSTSPLPLYPSKRDLALLASGIWPVYFHNRLPGASKRDTGLAVYLDVSGSVNDHLPEIISAIGKLKAELTTLFLFSNRVVEISLKELLKGKVETTWGTDFDCIARSIIEKKFDRAVVITDGYAKLSDDLAEKLKTLGTAILTILFGGPESCDELEPFGDVVKLDDI